MIKFDSDDIEVDDMGWETQDPKNYEEWLEIIEEDDTPENREWYDLPDDERSDWLEDHPDF